MEMKESTLWFGMILLVLVLSGFLLIKESNITSSDSGPINTKGINGKVAVNAPEVQIVKIYVEGSNYIFEPSSVKKGLPVRLEADMNRMPGCSRSVVSTQLGIRKTFTTNDNTVEFTPIKAGTFYIACSMNMYKGNLIVLESDGTKTNYVQAAPSTSGSCGANSGGCGCGGAS